VKLPSSIVQRLVEMMPIFSMLFFHINISILPSFSSYLASQSQYEIISDLFFFKLRLLGLYLDPQNGKEPMFTAAVRLLHNHGESLDPMQVLEVLLYYCMYTGILFENLVACMVVCMRLLFWTSVF